MGQARYPQELKDRAVRMVQEHRGDYGSEWQAITSVATKVGVHPDSLKAWLRREQIDAGQRAGLTTDEREHTKALEREVRELRRANEILKSASAFFARELDPQPKR